MLKSIRRMVELQLLKIRLSGLFKLAEQHAQNGIPKGDVIYLRLLGQVGTLILQFEAKYERIDADVEIPAYRDLKALCEPEKKMHPAMIAASVIGSVLLGAIASGWVIGLASIGYHMVSH